MKKSVLPSSLKFNDIELCHVSIPLKFPLTSNTSQHPNDVYNIANIIQS